MEIEEEEEQTLIGFCVLGGIFGEGIDLKKDSLIGVIVVGTGLPQVGCEREILKDYFDDNGENGFDYSYRYPGMNKVCRRRDVSSGPRKMWGLSSCWMSVSGSILIAECSPGSGNR